ncbi:MAG: hypothetical protein V1858_05665 [Candidatus Gottesmanbacteria bacterium]
MEETQQPQQTPQSAPQSPPSSAKASEGKEINVMALISYIGPLCLIPLLTKEQDEFVRFHMKQGFVLFVAEIATSILLTIIPPLWAIGWIINVIWLVLSIIGIMSVVKNEKKELPIVGKYADRFKI